MTLNEWAVLIVSVAAIISVLVILPYPLQARRTNYIRNRFKNPPSIYDPDRGRRGF